MTRNAALKIASGEYIGFVDPDDWVEPCMFERLYQVIVNDQADISMCGYLKEKIDGNVLNKMEKPQVITLNRNQTLNTILNSNGFRGFTWNKLFSNDLLKNNDIEFDEAIHFCEDLLFCCQYISKSRKIVYDTRPYYHYIIHDNNVVNLHYSHQKLTSLKALEKITILLSEDKGLEIENFKDYYMHLNISLLINSLYEKNIKQEIRGKLKKNLYQFRISDLKNRFVKVSCVIARINVHLYYFLWKIFKKGSYSC